MDKDEARAILGCSPRGAPSADLLLLMGDVHVAEGTGRSGTQYQIEVEVI
jgi:hypothetical protein